MGIDLSKGVAALDNILSALRELEPLAGAIGSVADVAAIGVATANIAKNAVDRAKAAEVALSGRDEAVLKAVLFDLQARNDALAKAIAES